MGRVQGKASRSGACGVPVRPWDPSVCAFETQCTLWVGESVEW